MAKLVSCSTCNKEVSSSARTCPHCGEKLRRPRRLGVLLVILAVLVGIAMLGKRPTDQPTSPQQVASSPAAEQKAAEERHAAEEKLAEEQRCSQDLHCIAEKAIFIATQRCKPAVERLAKYNFEWIDKWYEPKFSHYRWKNKDLSIVTYIGDKIRYQNGFGGWIISIYECDFDIKGERVVDARAQAGRLPE